MDVHSCETASIARAAKRDSPTSCAIRSCQAGEKILGRLFLDMQHLSFRFPLAARMLQRITYE